MSSDSSFPRPPIRRLDVRTKSDPQGVVVAAGRADTETETEASTSSERPLPLRRRKDDVGQVVAFPRPVSAKRRRADPSGVERTALAPAEPPAMDAQEPAPSIDAELPLDPALRPAYLASELLREDWFPRSPLARTVRWGALGMGAAGAVGTIAFGGTAFGPLVLASILACCALAGLVPFSAPQRGVALAVLGIAGTAFVGWVRMVDDPGLPLLAFGIILASSALLFRAAHRTSRLARVLAALGLLTLAAWIVLTGGLDALVIESFAWQHVAGPAVRAVLGITVVAGVLTFLDPTGHGGAWAVGAALVGWLALDVGLTMAIAAWPVRGAAAVSSDDAWVATLAYPFLAALGAGGLCQVWVLASRPVSPQARRAQ